MCIFSIHTKKDSISATAQHKGKEPSGLCAFKWMKTKTSFPQEHCTIQGPIVMASDCYSRQNIWSFYIMQKVF